MAASYEMCEDVQKLRDQDIVLDIDNLKQFTIPKKMKPSNELFELLTSDSLEYRNDILPLIQCSYKDSDNHQHFKYSNPRIVRNNRRLEEKKKYLKHAGYSDKEIQEVYRFQSFSSSAEARRVCDSGIKVGNKLLLKCLGNPQLGVYLCKHADVIFGVVPKPQQTGTLVIFKVIKGRIKYLKEGQGNESLEPTPNFDGHELKVANADTTGSSVLSVYQSSQMYLYEYKEDSYLVEKPGQIFPYAVVDYCYTGTSKDYSRAYLSTKSHGGTAAPSSLKKPKSAELSSTGSSETPTADMPASPLIPKSGDKPDTPPVKLPRIQWPADVVRTLPSQQSGWNKFTTGNCRSTGWPSWPGRSGIRRNVTGPADFAFQCEKSGADRPVCAGLSNSNYELEADNVYQIGERRDSLTSLEKHVIWTGDIAVNGATICSGEMVSWSLKEIHPNIGAILNLASKLSTPSIRSRYQQLSQVSRMTEQCSCSMYFNYAILSPTSADSSQFTRFTVYLVKCDAAAVVEYSSELILLLFPNHGAVAADLGFTPPRDADKECLHVLIVSTRSLLPVVDQATKTSPPATMVSAPDGALSPAISAGDPRRQRRLSMTESDNSRY